MRASPCSMRRGRLVQTVADGSYDAGRHVVTWDGRDRSGSRVSPGTYFSVLQAEGQRRARKITVLE